MKAKGKIALSMVLVVSLFAGCGKAGAATKDKASVKDKVTTEVTVSTTEVATNEAEEEVTTEQELKKDDEGFTLTDDYVQVVDEVAYVQAEPSQSSATYRLYEKDDVVKRTGYKDGWTRVIVDDYEFYIASSALKEAEIKEEEMASDTDAATVSDATCTKPKKIVIDPANQMEVNLDTEEIGPGSDEKKQGASVGHVGVAKETREYELNLKYALALKEKLEDKGYEVILTRDSNDVNISNKKRAEIANESGATAFLRIQMNYSEDPYATGIMAISMKEDNIYNSQLYKESNNFATRMLQGISEKTDVVNHGIYETDQMTSINWSGLPVTIIKLGYLSNEAEEAKLISDKYMNKLVDGMAKGIDYYFQ